MILDCQYSPTHQAMARRFLIPTATQHGLSVRHRLMQWDVSNEYDAPGALEMTTCEFVKLLFSEPCTGELRLFCGVDVVFLKEWPSWCEAYMRAGGYQIAWAWDANVPCMDFIAFYDTLEARKYLIDCHWKTFETAQNQTPPGSGRLAFVNNQFINAQLLQAASFRWGVFPENIVVNWPAIVGSATHWQGQDIVVPEAARVFHANWTVGVVNKTAMLEQVMRGRA